uniref:DIX domain-containing protein n=1 Tax=Acrobeloides nanus TaxID=290746 RepID=A0A914D3G3_9BILA
MVSAPDERTTKVYYYLDDSTPYVSVVPVPPDQICLGDFKKVFNRKDFKYFCKELDNDIGREVKVELIKDETCLKKSPNGLFELFLLPANQGHGTLPRNSYRNGFEESAGYRLNKRRSMQALSSTNGDLDMNGGQRVSMMTTDQSISAGGSMHTFIR